MKKTFLSIFIGAFLVICLIPLVCMLFAKSDEPVGNETRVSLPGWKTEDGRVNTEILGEFGNWFEHHFAFRPQLITADAKIQKTVFQVSNTPERTDGCIIPRPWTIISEEIRSLRGACGISRITFP